MNKIIVILSILFVSTVCFSQKKETDDVIQEAYMKSNKETIYMASLGIDYFSKYQDTSKTVTQSDFDKLMSAYVGNVQGSSDGGLTKEQAFSTLDWYIKASEGKKEKHEEETIDETEGGDFPKTEEEKLKEKAENELPRQIKSIIGGMSYQEFKELMLMGNPNATQSQIKKEYQKMQNSIKNFFILNKKK